MNETPIPNENLIPNKNLKNLIMNENLNKSLITKENPIPNENSIMNEITNDPKWESDHEQELRIQMRIQSQRSIYQGVSNHEQVSN